MNHTATYSPDDNKIRIYPACRLAADELAKVKAAGYKWAPKQQLFVAPMWTPQRERVAIELAGEITDDDTSLAARAEERSERFDGYADRRAADSESAHKAVRAIADNIPFGQPILIGHHSERHARKDAARIDNLMRKAVNNWETAKYWEQRADAAIAHAKYKERPDVRARRIKGIEADKRKSEKYIADSQAQIALWQADGLTMARAKAIANTSHISRCFPLADYPRDLPASQYEGQMGIWSALDGGIITAEQARDICIASCRRVIASNEQWLAHYNNRLTYERAMLAADGGLAADKFDIKPGGQVQIMGKGWLVVLRVNRKGGAIVSVTTASQYVSVRGIEEVTDYRPPSDSDAAAVSKATKLAPLVNFPSDDCVSMTAAEYKALRDWQKYIRRINPSETTGAYRQRFAGGVPRRPVYLTDAKRVDIPAPSARVAPITPHFDAPEPRQVPVKAEPSDIDAMRDMLRNGSAVQVVTAPTLFPTPAPIAAQMVEAADIQPGARILEPSAGTGALIRAVLDAQPDAEITAVEINSTLAARLSNEGASTVEAGADFLTLNPEQLGRFDRVIMNPPFNGADDIRHILHALKFVAVGGKLVALCADGPRQRKAFETISDSYTSLPPGSFKDQGTGVNVAMVVLTNDSF